VAAVSSGATVSALSVIIGGKHNSNDELLLGDEKDDAEPFPLSIP